MTTTIPRISGATISGKVTAAGVAAASVQAATAPRVVNLPDAMFRLAKRAGLKPPEPGELMDGDETDAAMRVAGLGVGERIALKSALRDVGLLPANKPR